MPMARMRMLKSLLFGKTQKRKGPYTADRMTIGQRRLVEYSLGRLRATSLLCLAALGGCGDPDPRNIRGAIEAAMADIAADEGEQLYLHIDERARHALGGIVVARHKAKKVIESSYPPSERAAALSALGDGAIARNAAALFAMRCPRACMKEMERNLGAPAEQKFEGNDVIVRTVRGTTTELHLGSDTWYGVVWHTAELMAERDRAARELTQIEENAALYRKQRGLQAASKHSATLD